MANRRMFSKEIVRSDAFLDMPISSQLLYFQLGMEADDDGFVDNAKTVSRITGTANDDLKILLSKRFLLPFDNGILVIKHWKINNYIQTDRYKETKYLEEKKGLTTKENRAYTECIQPVSTLDAQIRLGKTSIGKKRKDKIAAKNAADPVKDKFKDETPRTIEEYVELMRSSPHRYIRLIGEYADTIKPSNTTKGQWHRFTNRNVRQAKNLEPYSDEQISKAFGKIEKAKYLTKWTLETLEKYIE